MNLAMPENIDDIRDIATPFEATMHPRIAMIAWFALALSSTAELMILLGAIHA